MCGLIFFLLDNVRNTIDFSKTREEAFIRNMTWHSKTVTTFDSYFYHILIIVLLSVMLLVVFGKYC